METINETKYRLFLPFNFWKTGSIEGHCFGMRIAFFHSLGLKYRRILGRTLRIRQFHHGVLLHPGSSNLVRLVKEPENCECNQTIPIRREYLHDMVLGSLVSLLVEDKCFPHVRAVVHHTWPPGISWKWIIISLTF